MRELASARQPRDVRRQDCGLARALDHVGDRWTLLIIRELLLRNSTYGELLAALDGIPTNFLAGRLRSLQAGGLVTKEVDPDDLRRSGYRLTPLGREIEPALLALIKWGTRWMRTGRSSDKFETGWTLLALRALLLNRNVTRHGTLELRVDGVDALSVTTTPDGSLHVRHGSTPHPAAIVAGDGELLLGLMAGGLPLNEVKNRGLRIQGDRALIKDLLIPHVERPLT